MSESALPEIGGRRPIPVNVEAGKSYWWCAFGESAVLRRLAQRHRLHTGRIQAGGCRRSMVLRLQALQQKANVRRES